MENSIEVQGKTEDEAIALALEQLGLSRDDVSVEIVEQAKTGFMGLKSTPAIVKVTYGDSLLEENILSDKTSTSSASSSPRSKPRSKQPSKTSGSERTARYDSRKDHKRRTTPVDIPSDFGDKVTGFLSGLFERMGHDVKMELAELPQEGSVLVTLSCEDAGAVIGRRGETLDALQNLSNYALNKGASDRVRITLDIGNYRTRRNEALETLAIRTASKVAKYKRNMTLDPMNAYERHVIHTALQDNANISTYSVGTEPNRKIVIAYGRVDSSRNNSDSAQKVTPQSAEEPSQTTAYREWS